MPSIAIRWSSNTEELKKNLRDGVDVINATKAAAEKLAQSLSGDNMIAAAQKYAAAVNLMADKSKLVGENQARVNDIMSRAVAHLEATGQGSTALATHFKELRDATQTQVSAGEKFTGWLKTANGLLGAFGIGLSVTAVVSYGKALLDDADALTKLSDKTGVTVEGLQRLQIVGDDAGNTIDQMTSAITQMENRLASGDSSAVAAVKELGLDLEQLKNLNPENQFIAISDAIRTIQDPATQVRLAIDLFGKSGAEVLPSLKKGFDDVKDSAQVMSAETVKAFDEAGDAIARWGRTLKGVSMTAVVDLVHIAEAGFNPLIAAANKGGAALQASIDSLNKAAKGPSAEDKAKRLPEQLKALTVESARTQRAYKELDEQERKNEQTTTKHTEAVKRQKEEFERLGDKARELERGGLKFYNEGLEKVGETTQEITRLSQNLAAVDVFVGATLEQAGLKANFLDAQLEDLGPTLKQAGLDVNFLAKDLNTFIGPTLQEAGLKAPTSFADGLKSGIGGALQGFPQSLVAALEGGGGVEGAFKALGVKLADALVSSIVSSVTASAAAGGAAGSLSALGPIVAGVLVGYAIYQTSGHDTTVADVINEINHAVEQSDPSRLDALVKAYEHLLSVKANHPTFNGSFFGVNTDELRQQFDAAIQQAKDAADLIRAGQKYGPNKDQLNELAAAALHTYELMKNSGKFSAEQVAQAWEDSLRATRKAAGDTALDMEDALAAAGYVTIEAAQKTAAEYQKQYEYMVASGKFSAASIAEAFKKASLAQFDTMKDSTKAAIQSIKDLDAQYKALSDSVAQEAPEEVMGSIEAQNRGAMAALAKQSEDARKKLLDEGEIAADQLEIILSSISPSPVHVPVVFDVPGLPTGSAAHAATGGIVTRSGFEPFPIYAATGYLGRGTDTIHAMVSPNEMISSVQDTQRIIRMADAIVSGRAPMPTGSLNVGEVVQVLKGIRLAQAELPAAIVQGVSNAILLGLA